MQQVENTVQTALAQAKQGDPQALTKLMREPLKPKGIEVDIERKGALLFISLSGKQCPPKSGSLSYVRQGLQKLGIEGIEAVRLSGYIAGEHHPQWVERLPLQASQHPGQLTGQLTGHPTAQASSPGTLVHQRKSPEDQAPVNAPWNAPWKKGLLVVGSLIVLVGLVGWLTTTILLPASDSEPPALEQGQDEQVQE